MLSINIFSSKNLVSLLFFAFWLEIEIANEKQKLSNTKFLEFPRAKRENLCFAFFKRISPKLGIEICQKLSHSHFR
jgi:hypothetical protein